MLTFLSFFTLYMRDMRDNYRLQQSDETCNR
nr:MAG TPA: hypothetical protein [Caudoviricetes sp.]